MLRNPIHKRLARFSHWQLKLFMLCLCERMLPNYQVFCYQTKFTSEGILKKILDIIWESLIIKGVKVNFDTQLNKLEDAIPNADLYDIYGVYPAIDACVALSEVLHAHLDGDFLAHAICVSETSLYTVAMLEMTHSNKEMNDDQLKKSPLIQNELDVQWAIFRLLLGYEKPDAEFTKELKMELRTAAMSNIGIKSIYN